MQMQNGKFGPRPKILSHFAIERLEQRTLLSVSLVADLNTNTASSSPFGIADGGNGRAFFFANDGLHGEEPYITDGTSLGIIQDMVMPPREVVRALGPPGFRWAAGLGANSIQTLLCIAEDEPQKGRRRPRAEPVAPASTRPGPRPRPRREPGREVLTVVQASLARQ